MPSRNIVKTYVAGGYYHIYNRGIEKRIIFEDEMDYKTFLKYLKEALSPLPDSRDLKVSFSFKGATFKGLPRPVKNFVKDVNLIAYCLMPNHFHLLVTQNSVRDINRFMQSIITRYSMFFNKKYNRIGKLFQGHYKAVLISDENYLLHLSRYIHLNPSEYTDDLEAAYSSYSEYLGKRKTLWIKPEVILSFFKTVSKDFMQGINTYKDFVERSRTNSGLILGNLTLESES